MIGIGERVRIPPDLTYDPKNKQGEYGMVIAIFSDIVTVQFQDGEVGDYDIGIWE